MDTHLNYPHANLGDVTVAEIVKHSRFGCRHKMHSWIRETNFEITILYKRNNKH